MLEVKVTDKFFYDSPDAGDPECICSRCGKQIPEKDSPILRCWPEKSGDHGFDAAAKGGTEFRYCRQCCEQMGMTYPDGIEETENEIQDKDYCKYCKSLAYKTNGRAEPICYNRAHTGKCEGNKPRSVKTVPGRNEPCSCGSGKKYKYCCYEFDQLIN
jgi:hypothetical protein